MALQIFFGDCLPLSLALHHLPTSINAQPQHPFLLNSASQPNQFISSITFRSHQPHHAPWPPAEMPPLSPTQQYEPDSKTAPASMSPLGSSRVDASTVAASQDGPEDSTSSMSPRLTCSFFLHDFPPPPALVRPWPRQRRRCGMPAVIRFDVFIVVVVVVAVILGLDILCCGHRHLSRCAVASLVAPPPLSPRRRHYHRANACLIAPLSRQRLAVASSPLSP